MHLLTELGLVGRENTWLEVMAYREPNFSQSISVYHNTFVMLILIKNSVEKMFLNAECESLRARALTKQMTCVAPDGFFRTGSRRACVNPSGPTNDRSSMLFL